MQIQQERQFTFIYEYLQEQSQTIQQQQYHQQHRRQHQFPFFYEKPQELANKLQKRRREVYCKLFSVFIIFLTCIKIMEMLYPLLRLDNCSKVKTINKGDD